MRGYRYRGTGTEPDLSPDGTAVFWTDAGSGFPDPLIVTARRVATGKSTTRRCRSSGRTMRGPVWVSPSGDRIAFSLGYQSPDSAPLEPAEGVDGRRQLGDVRRGLRD